MSHAPTPRGGPDVEPVLPPGAGADSAGIIRHRPPYDNQACMTVRASRRVSHRERDSLPAGQLGYISAPRPGVCLPRSRAARRSSTCSLGASAGRRGNYHSPRRPPGRPALPPAHLNLPARKEPSWTKASVYAPSTPRHAASSSTARTWSTTSATITPTPSTVWTRPAIPRCCACTALTMQPGGRTTITAKTLRAASKRPLSRRSTRNSAKPWRLRYAPPSRRSSRRS